MTTILLDGDLIAYKIASAVEKAVDWGDGLWTLSANLDEAKSAVQNYVSGIAKKLEASKVWLCFSDTENFRKKVYPEYKANRKDTRPPILRQPLVAWMKEFYPSKVFPELEADDVLGILATINSADRPVVVSEDKDLKQIPGLIFNPAKDQEPKEVTEDKADFQFYLQVLTGDTTDNYKGCPGVGTETAEHFLRHPYICFQAERELKSGKRKGQKVLEWHTRPLGAGETIWTAIVSLYAKAGLTEADALTQARCARILRASDYDAKKMNLKLWEPVR